MSNFLILGLIFLMGCTAGTKESRSKLDAPLRQKLTAQEQAKSSEPIRIIGKCTRAIEAQIKEELLQTGIELGVIAGAIFTASATPAQIQALAKLDIVEQLQLSVERDSRFP